MNPAWSVINCYSILSSCSCVQMQIDVFIFKLMNDIIPTLPVLAALTIDGQSKKKPSHSIVSLPSQRSTLFYFPGRRGWQWVLQSSAPSQQRQTAPFLIVLMERPSMAVSTGCTFNWNVYMHNGRQVWVLHWFFSPGSVLQSHCEQHCSLSGAFE